MAELTHGADPDALDALADEMLHTAERIALVGRYYLDALTNLAWSGPDAERARQQWAYLWLTAIRPTSMALATASGEARTNAAQQRAASEGTAAVATPGTGAPATTSQAPPSGTTAEDRPIVTMDRIRTLLSAGPDIATVVAAARAWENGTELGTYALASKVLTEGSGLARVGGRALGVAGLAFDGKEIYEAVRDGDAAGAVMPGVSAGLGIAALAGVSSAGPLGAAWGVGTVIGDVSYEKMQGTTYGEHVRERNEMAFDTMGASGMLVVPGNLVLGAYDTAVDAVSEALTDAFSDDPADDGGGR